jgi:hypothetical protein
MFVPLDGIRLRALCTRHQFIVIRSAYLTDGFYYLPLNKQIKMTPHETLAQHEDLIKLVLEHQYLPQAESGKFGEVIAALRLIDPAAKYDPGCSGCIQDIIRMANVHLQNYKKANFYKF